MPTLLAPPIIDDIGRRGLLTGAAAVALLAAGARETTPDAPPANPIRQFAHALGVTEIPVTPRRVVALNVTAADPVLTLAEAVLDDVETAFP